MRDLRGWRTTALLEGVVVGGGGTNTRSFGRGRLDDSNCCNDPDEKPRGTPPLSCGNGFTPGGKGGRGPTGDKTGMLPNAGSD